MGSERVVENENENERKNVIVDVVRRGLFLRGRCFENLKNAGGWPGIYISECT